MGYASINQMEFDFIGFLDADVSFGPYFFENLFEKCMANPRLGLAGGEIQERHNGRFQSRLGNSRDCVAGAAQLFRRECFEEIGGYVRTSVGGHDPIAVTMTKAKGWQVESFPDLPVFHHRPTGTAGTTRLRAQFRQGMQDYGLGYHPIFEAAKCIRRAGHPPRLIGSLLQFVGYLWAVLTRQREPLPQEYVRYLKREQIQRLYQSVLRP
jgi:hypothetical protein